LIEQSFEIEDIQRSGGEFEDGPSWSTQRACKLY